MSPLCPQCLSSHDLVILACLIICFVVSRHVSVVGSCPLSLLQWLAMNMVKISPNDQQRHYQYVLETKHNAIVAFIYLKLTLIWKWITSSTKCHFNCSFILPFLVDSKVIVNVCHFLYSLHLYLVSCIFDSCLSLELMIIQDVHHCLEWAWNVSHPLPPQWKLRHLKAPHCVLTVLFSAPWTLPPWSFFLPPYLLYHYSSPSPCPSSLRCSALLSLHFSFSLPPSLPLSPQEEFSTNWQSDLVPIPTSHLSFSLSVSPSLFLSRERVLHINLLCSHLLPSTFEPWPNSSLSPMCQ